MPGRPDLIFIHIPKTAGISVRSALSRYCYLDFMHDNPSAIISKIGEHYWEKAVKFSVVRHPCDRLSSLYHWIMQLEPTDLSYAGTSYQRQVFSRYSSFEDMVLNVESERMVTSLFLPISYWLTSADHRSVCDFILRYENLAEEWAGFAKNFGLPEVLPRLNTSPPRRAWQELFTKPMLCRMRGLYGECATRYGYII